MCNANNHPPGCTCGWGGGYWAGKYTVNNTSRTFTPPEFDAIKAFMNPNALCPVCGAPVFFYQSPYNGRVFFDEIGPPWKKHPCTDNGRSLGIAEKASSRLPKCIEDGWVPFKLVEHIRLFIKNRHIGFYITGFTLPENNLLDRLHLQTTDSSFIKSFHLFIKLLDDTQYELAFYDQDWLVKRTAIASRNLNTEV